MARQRNDFDLAKALNGERGQGQGPKVSLKPMETKMEELQEHFVEVLRQCIDNGMKLPFVVSAISPNGSALVMRINDGRGPDTLAQHFEDDAFKTPVNIMVVDHDGEAARVVITGDEISYQ